MGQDVPVSTLGGGALSNEGPQQADHLKDPVTVLRRNSNLGRGRMVVALRGLGGPSEKADTGQVWVEGDAPTGKAAWPAWRGETVLQTTGSQAPTDMQALGCGRGMTVGPVVKGDP